MSQSEPLATEDQLLQGKQVGRTEDGLEIYQVKDNQQYLILKGFMFPGTVFKKVST